MRHPIGVDNEDREAVTKKNIRLFEYFEIKVQGFDNETYREFVNWDRSCMFVFEVNREI